MNRKNINLKTVNSKKFGIVQDGKPLEYTVDIEVAEYLVKNKFIEKTADNQFSCLPGYSLADITVESLLFQKEIPDSIDRFAYAYILDYWLETEIFRDIPMPKYNDLISSAVQKNIEKLRFSQKNVN